MIGTQHSAQIDMTKIVIRRPYLSEMKLPKMIPVNRVESYQRQRGAPVARFYDDGGPTTELYRKRESIRIG
jgi:hypothetical protein